MGDQLQSSAQELILALRQYQRDQLESALGGLTTDANAENTIRPAKRVVTEGGLDKALGDTILSAIVDASDPRRAMSMPLLSDYQISSNSAYGSLDGVTGLIVETRWAMIGSSIHVRVVCDMEDRAITSCIVDEVAVLSIRSAIDRLSERPVWKPVETTAFSVGEWVFELVALATALTADGLRRRRAAQDEFRRLSSDRFDIRMLEKHAR